MTIFNDVELVRAELSDTAGYMDLTYRVPTDGLTYSNTIPTDHRF
ncbi:hypothetical protein clg_12 [Corynebacterium phage CL31]|nr:hypothetical protein clg_12 [Corynebacterium phage CL31]